MPTNPQGGSNTARLLELGFEEAGSWALVDNKPRVTLGHRRDVCPALYALVEDDIVVYVGKSIKTMRHRMQHYQTPGPTQRTGLRNHASITSSLGSGRNVKVFVLVCDTPIDYRGIKLNIAAALEDPLIALFRPAWNKNGVSKGE